MKKLIFLIAFLNATLLIAQPFGNVAVLDGVNDFIETPNAFGTDFNNAVTIEAWINPCETTGYRVIASKWYCTGDENGFFFSIFNGKLRFTWDSDACTNGSNTYQSNAAIIQTNQWQHVAVAHDSDGVQLYLNGISVPSSLTTGSVYSTIQTSTEKLRIGTYKIGATTFVGKYEGLIDEVRLWDAKRSAAEISSNYLASLSGTQTNLVGYYKMNLTTSGNNVSVPNSATATGAAVLGTTIGTVTTPIFKSQNFNAISTVLGNDTILCSSNPSFVLDASVADGTYLWDNGSTVATRTITASGQYSVIITVGCIEYFDTIQVTFQSLPVVNLGNDTTLCTGQTVTLDASSSGGSYLWQNGSTSSGIVVSQAGIYSVVVDVNGCSTTEDITVSYTTPPSLNLGPDHSICAGSQATLDATNSNATYLWSTGATNPTISVTQTGVYFVEVGHHCGNVYDSITINVNPIPSLDLGPDTTLCNGQTILLNALQAGGTYVWQDGSVAPDFTVSQAGTYSVTAMVNGCSKTDNITVSYIAPASVNLGADDSICQPSSLVLDATNPSATYLWSNNATTPTITVSQSDVYSVEVFHYCGVVKDTIAITVNARPIVTLGADTTLCTGQSMMLDVTTIGATYTWQDGTTSPNILVSQPGNYSATVTKNGCSGSDDITVSYISPANINLGEDQSICQGSSIVLNATNASSTYTWSTASVSPTISVNQTGTYSVAVDHYCGVVYDTVTITVNPLPVISLGNDTTLCTGASIILDGVISGGTYLWQDGSTLPQLLVSQAGNYALTVTTNGCSATDNVVVLYTAPASVDLGVDQSICQGGSLNLDATNAAATYLWSTGEVSPIISVNQAGQYSVAVDHYCGIVRDTIMLNVNALPTVSLGNDTTLCTGQSVTLDGTTTSGSYLWQDGSTSSQLSVNQAGTYSLTVTRNGCSSTDNIFVSYTAPASVDLGVDQSICQGGSLSLDASNLAATYLWSTGEINPIISVNQTGQYSVAVSHYCGIVRDTIMLTVNALPIVNLGNDTTLCTGQSVTLDGTTASGSYLWQDGSTASHLLVSQAGAYGLTVTNNGCSSTDNILVSYIAPAFVDLGGDQSVCQGVTVTLNASNPSATYLWSNGSTNPAISVAQTGVYSVAVNHYCGVVKDTISVIVNPLPIVDFGADTTLCIGEVLNLNASLAGGTYLWQDGSTGAQLLVSSAGSYSVVTTVNGCTATDDIIVDYTSLQIDLGPDLTLCEGDNVLLSAMSGGANYLWQDGSTNSSYNVTNSGVYIVKVNNIACEIIDSVSVIYELLDKNISVETNIDCGFSELMLSASPISVVGSIISPLHWKINGVSEFVGNLGKKRITEEGDYLVELFTTVGNCQIDTTFSLHMSVYDIPVVDFRVSNNNPDVEEIIYFSNYSDEDLTYSWDFGNGETSNSFDATTNYSKASSYVVSLKGENVHCSASADMLITIKEPLLYYIPNAFTPVGSQNNNIFMPVFTSGFDPYDYQIRIFNRWGELMFLSNDPNVGWDGIYAGELQESGVYVWEVSFGKLDNANRINKTGMVTLLK